MRILVTGGTGFLGQHLVPLLVASGHEVRVLARTALPKTLKGAAHHPGDLKDRASVRAALQGVEVVYHLAGLVSFKPKDARRMYTLHVDCTRDLLEDARAAKISRFVLASTSGAIAVSKQARIGSEADAYPIEVVGRWPYYASKIFEEQLTREFCRKHALPLVILNPSLLLGPGDDRLSSTWTVMRFLQGEIPTLPGGGLSFVDVRDAAAAFAAALTLGELHGRHLMGVNMAFTEFFARLERLTGVPAPRVQLPSGLNVLGAKLLEKWAERRGVDATLDPQEVEIAEHFFYLDASKAERELGFLARDPHQTLFDTVQYLLAKMPEASLPGWKGKLHALREGT